jgi:hypothetical protein
MNDTKTTKIKTRLDNGVIGIPADSRFGTALFTRLQLWTMLGEDSELGKWNRQLEAAIPSRTCREV